MTKARWHPPSPLTALVVVYESFHPLGGDPSLDVGVMLKGGEDRLDSLAVELVAHQ